MGLGRLLLWLNVFVVPTAVTCMAVGVYAGAIVGAVSLLNAWYLDTRVRPKVERLGRVLEKLLRS